MNDIDLRIERMLQLSADFLEQQQMRVKENRVPERLQEEPEEAAKNPDRKDAGKFSF